MYDTTKARVYAPGPAVLQCPEVLVHTAGHRWWLVVDDQDDGAPRHVRCTASPSQAREWLELMDREDAITPGGHVRTR